MVISWPKLPRGRWIAPQMLPQQSGASDFFGTCQVQKRQTPGFHLFTPPKRAPPANGPKKELPQTRECVQSGPPKNKTWGRLLRPENHKDGARHPEPGARESGPGLRGAEVAGVLAADALGVEGSIAFRFEQTTEQTICRLINRFPSGGSIHMKIADSWMEGGRAGGSHIRVRFLIAEPRSSLTAPPAPVPNPLRTRVVAAAEWLGWSQSKHRPRQESPQRLFAPTQNPKPFRSQAF